MGRVHPTFDDILPSSKDVAAHPLDACKDQCDTPTVEPALHGAIKLRDFELTSQLLQRKADVDEREHGSTALHLAACFGNVELVSVLLRYKADIDATNDEGRTPLQLACLAAAVRQEDAQVEEAKNSSLLTTMVSMTFRGTVHTRHSARRDSHDGKVVDEKDGLPKYTQVVSVLLQMQANLLAMDVDGRTALHMAAENACHDQNQKILRLLLDGNCDPWAPDHVGRTAVDLVLKTGALEALAAFVERGIKTFPIFLKLVQFEGDETVELLQMWPEEAKVFTGKEVKILEKAKLRDDLRTIIAPRAALQAEVVAVKEKWIDLSKQNLVFQPEVRACLKVLPSITPGNIWNSELLDALTEANNLGIFQSEVVEAVISAAWEQMRAYTALDIGARLLTVIALSCASVAFRTEGMLFESLFSLLLAAGLHLKQSVEEVCQHLTGVLTYALRGKHYSVLDFDTVFDLSYLVTGWIAIGRQLWTQSLEKNFMALYCGMSWLRVLWALRGGCWMGPGLLPILYALKDTMAFFIVTITSLLAATHAYYNLQIKDAPSPFYGSFVNVVRLGIFSDFDLLDFEGISSTLIYQEDAGGYVSVAPDPGPNYNAVHCLFYIIGMGIAVLLMNLLIGVLGKNFDIYQGQSHILYLQARAKMLRDVRARPWQIRCLRRWKCKEKVSVVDFILLAPVTVSCLPLYPVLRSRFAVMIAETRELAKRYYGVALLLCIVSPVVLMLSIGLLFVWLLGGMFLSWSGMSHTLATTLGCAYESSQIPLIWCIARETQSEDDTSLRWYLKSHFKKIEDKMEAIYQELDAMKIDLLVRPMPNAENSHFVQPLQKERVRPPEVPDELL